MTADTDALRLACEGIADDYMTSEAHHPNHVLIPTEKFNAIVEALAAAPAVKPAAGMEGIARIVLDAVFEGFEHGECEKEWEPDYGREIAAKATGKILAALAPAQQGEAEPFMYAYENVDAPGEWQAYRHQLKRADGSICPGKPLYAHPPAQASESGPRLRLQRYLEDPAATYPGGLDQFHGDIAALSAPQAAPDPRVSEWGYSSTDEALTHLGTLLADQTAFDGLAAPGEGEQS